MPLNLNNARKCLQDFDFSKLFIEELGWDRHVQRIDLTVDGQSFTLSAVAHKRGMVAFLDEGKPPDYPTRRKIERQVAKNVHEHLLIFTDPQRTTQIWQWVKREPGKPLACREHTYRRGQPGDSLIQKLQALAFSIEDEESLTIVDVTGRVRAGFDVERVTKRFYDKFKDEHTAFLGFIKGIPDDELQRWYASVMLNRLMFVYFIQKKGFLNGDPDYLRNKLAQSRKGGFYRQFLCPLFFEGFAKKAKNRSAATNQLLGKVPYLNGGIFQRHQIEELHGEKIQVADAAFEKLFGFFDQYQWHLDERPLRRDNEINPDVLGYIFEKYINQKQMGAYYTKEDITGYISQNTVLPFLFEVARAKCKVAFEGENSVWKLLQADPDRYIYPAVKKGVELPLPAEIAVGIKDVSKRTEWNKPAPAEYALPTEIWREVVARRQRYAEIRARLTGDLASPEAEIGEKSASASPQSPSPTTRGRGGICDINDLITYNLDIRQFAQDAIENAEPDLLWTFYGALKSITILDPTCGSGAFLFAALNILYPLYEACLNRMALFVAEWERTGSKAHPNYSKNFKAELARLEAHHNEPYFILKTIIVNNLYGVDIMDEAVEICKLRLFLKLVAQIESADDIEPLPDIDFNIRAGNTLVGYATYDEVKRAVTSKLDFDNAMAKIEDKAATLDSAFEMFRRQQTELGGEVTAADKRDLRKRLEALEDELNRYLATEYGIAASSPSGRGQGEGAAYAAWLHSHKPFHWFVEFYGIMKRGGFDVIIGNPPYVEYSKVKSDYTVRGYETESCGNLYTFVVERNLRLCRSKRSGMIIPSAAFGVPATAELRDMLKKTVNCLYVSYFSGDAHPSTLFEGVKLRLSIYLSATSENARGGFELYTTPYMRWYAEERSALFNRFAYTEVPQSSVLKTFPKCGSVIETQILSKIQKQGKFAVTLLLSKTTNHSFHYHNAPVFFIRAMDFVPHYESVSSSAPSSNHFKTLFAQSAEIEKWLIAVLNSTTFYVWFTNYSANRDLTMFDIEYFPLFFDKDKIHGLELGRMIKGLMEDLRRNSVTREYNYTTGNVRYQEFYMRKSKYLIDEIDRVLAKHYGFTDEELDFIINYDIKYRMGLNSDDNEVEE